MCNPGMPQTQAPASLQCHEWPFDEDQEDCDVWGTSVPEGRAMLSLIEAKAHGGSSAEPMPFPGSPQSQTTGGL